MECEKLPLFESLIRLADFVKCFLMKESMRQTFITESATLFVSAIMLHQHFNYTIFFLLRWIYFCYSRISSSEFRDELSLAAGT